jgi:hypothetical protein
MGLYLSVSISSFGPLLLRALTSVTSLPVTSGALVSGWSLAIGHLESLLRGAIQSPCYSMAWTH